MKIKQIRNKSKNFHAYFHRKTICKGYPEVFNIELTNSCPMKCIMCPRKYMKRKVGFMKFDLYQKIIDQLKGYTYAIWLHHFGESLLHPEIDKFIDYAKQNKIKTQLSINPVLLNKNNIQKIINLDYLHISLDGTNEETYKKLRGKNADYNKAIKLIHEFLREKNKPYTTLAIIRMKETETELEHFKKQWKNSGINNIEIKEFTTWDGSIKEIHKLISKPSEAYQKNLQYPCIRPWHRITILWDGRVVPCCYDYDGKYILGDLNKQTLKEIWNSQEILELRRQQIFNDLKNNKLCISCKEKYGMPESKLYPINPIFLKRVFKYFKQKLK